MHNTSKMLFSVFHKVRTYPEWQIFHRCTFLHCLLLGTVVYFMQKNNIEDNVTIKLILTIELPRNCKDTLHNYTMEQNICTYKVLS